MDKNQVELEVVDQLHISSISAETMAAGERFTVSAATAEDLVKRGLAKTVGGAKAAKATPNKAAAPANNKAAPAPISKSRRGG